MKSIATELQICALRRDPKKYDLNTDMMNRQNSNGPKRETEKAILRVYAPLCNKRVQM